MNTVEFAESHKDFVLKLLFSLEGGSTQIRRVRLPRIITDDGKVSYDELTGLAICFVFPQDPMNPKDFSVKLSYQDVDDDCVVVGSTEELLDAIDQFSNKKVLRITAEVKRRSRSKQLEVPEAVRVPSRASSTDASTQAGSRPLQPHPQLQNAVESIVTIVSAAAHSLHGQLKPHSQTTTNPVVAARMAESVEKSGNSEVKAANEAESIPRESSEDVHETAHAKTSAESTDDEIKPAAPEEETLFIHGRHTCDACLTTPIVGKRYHAKNMPDYDLCETCHGNYKGSEIEFEVAELDRDRPYQARWHRRHRRLNRAKCVSGSLGAGSCKVRRRRATPTAPREPKVKDDTDMPHSEPVPQASPFRLPVPPPKTNGGDRFMTTPGHTHHGHPHPYGVGHPPVRGYEPPPPPEHHHHGHGWHPCLGPRPHGPPPHHHPAHGWRPFGPPLHGPPLPHHHPYFVEPNAEAEGTNDQDFELEEAIRRSLADDRSGGPETAVLTPLPSAPTEEEVAQSVEKVDPIIDTATGAIEEENPPGLPTRSVEGEKDKSAKEAASSLASSPQEKLEASAHTEDIEKIPASARSFAAEIPSLAVAQEAEIVYCSDGSKVMVEAVKDKSKVELSPVKPESEKSFSSDAEGNGDVAAALGETLDIFSQAIDGLVSELDRPSSYEEESLDEDDEVFVGHSGNEEQPAGTEGETIVDSVGTHKADVNSADDDWQVVSDDQNRNTEGDAALAFAAQMIGSALFNSDMSRSAEMVSTISGEASASSVSSASSVPTTIASLASDDRISSSQRSRWSNQLQQLHELGFYNDGDCVEVLERLTAANIGVGSMDEVSVTQVVNELYRNM